MLDNVKGYAVLAVVGIMTISIAIAWIARDAVGAVVRMINEKKMP